MKQIIVCPILTLMIFLSFFPGELLAKRQGRFLVGTAKKDITGPIAEYAMMGYADPAQKTTGLHTRLYSRGLFFKDKKTGQIFIFVNCDLGFIPPLMRAEIERELKDRTGRKV